MRRRLRNSRFAVLSALTALLASGCASLPDPYATSPAAEQLARPDSPGTCLALLQSVDARIDAAGLRDNQAVRVAGYPYLRADRFTVRRKAPDDNWRAYSIAQIDRMAALDAEARALEMSNLGLSAAERVAVERCRDELVTAVRVEPAAAALAGRVPADYNDNLRVLGLYPLTSIPFAGGVRSWQESVRDVFRTPFPELPIEGKRIRYVPAASPAPASLAGWLPLTRTNPSAANDALGVPALDLARAWQLLQQHAPVLVVDTVSDDDRIGVLHWSVKAGAALPAVELRERVAYVRIAWTEIADQVVPQLVYAFWFPARPARNIADIEAGHLDGLIWRVTLGTDGRPLVYDSIHSCGCFHTFFPTERVRERPPPIEDEGLFDESLFAPQFVRAPAAAERVAVYVSARTHQIQRVAVEAAPSAAGQSYRLVDENVLRALPQPWSGAAVTRSIYGVDMRVAGTERPERWFYWPMGIESPGQMRQWGHHATAFVGRRHFDDPFLFDRYFTLAPRGDPQ